MRIYGKRPSEPLEEVTLLLTCEELQELLADVKGCLERIGQPHHAHIGDWNSRRTITIAAAEPEDIVHFAPSVRALFDTP